jgi:hypothetical protein
VSAVEIFTPGIRRYHFIPKLKHDSLVLVGESSVKMPDEYASTNYFALCNPKLSLDKIQSITFHMVRITSYVTAGICKRDKIPADF